MCEKTPRCPRRLLAFAVVLLAAVQISADDATLRVSVVPLSCSEGVLADDADMLVRLLESALVRSGAYAVITQTALDRVLAAQAASLQDYTDREYAVDLGKIISASHIFVGSVARLGRTYVVDLQLVEVENGRAVRAGTAEATSVDGFVEAAEYLADHFSGKTGAGRTDGAVDHRVRTYLDIGDRFMGLRRYETAIKQYEKALVLDEFNVDILWRIVTAMKEDMLAGSLYSYDAVSSGLDVALRDDYRRLRLVGQEEVEAVLEKIYTVQAIEPLLQDDVALLLDEAAVFKMEGRVDDAAAVLRRAFKMYPENPFVLAELGLLTVFEPTTAEEGQTGLKLIRAAVAASPDTPLFRLYLGRSLERRSSFPAADALRAYRAAADLAYRPDFWSRRIRAFARQSMQRIYYRLGSLEDGVLTGGLDMSIAERLEHMEYLVEAEVPFPSRTTVQNPDYYLGRLLLAAGRAADARAAVARLLPEDMAEWKSYQEPWIDLYEKVLVKTGDDPELLDTVRAKLKSLR